MYACNGILFNHESPIREFVQKAAEVLEMNLRWEVTGLEEKAFDEKGNVIVCVDAEYFRPTEVETLLGDAAKAKSKLGWTPKITFKELVTEMALADLELTRREVVLNGKRDAQIFFHPARSNFCTPPNALSVKCCEQFY